MSFQDVGSTASSPRRRSRQNSTSRRVASPPKKASSDYRLKLEQLRGKPTTPTPTPTSTSKATRERSVPTRPLEENPFIQIDMALMQHKKDHGWKKEQSLAQQSTTVPRPSPRSPFSKLNESVIQFQKMVADLEPLLSNSTMDSPENQWRTQILLRSAEDADADIQLKIREQYPAARDGLARAAFQKIERDFNRISGKFRSLLFDYEQQQRAEVAMLSAQQDAFDAKQRRTAGGGNRRRYQQQQQQQQQQQHHEVPQEDFFDRKMREREEEIKTINNKMHKVNQIYQELGKLVDDQQGKIDAVVGNIGYSRAAAQCGLEQLPKASSRRKNIEEAGDFDWKDPFITFHEDFLALQRDVVSFGVKKVGKATNIRCTPICGDDQVSNAEFNMDMRRQFV